MRNIARYLNVSTSKLYKNFSGKSEIYQLAGITLDESSMQKTVSALKAKKKNAKVNKLNDKAKDHHKEANCYTLNLNQTDSLRGLCFISGRRALKLVMDEILDFQHKIYKHKITLKTIRIFSEFLDTAKNMGWRINEKPNIITIIIKLHNIGISNLDPSMVEDVLKIIGTIKEG